MSTLEVLNKVRDNLRTEYVNSPIKAVGEERYLFVRASTVEQAYAILDNISKTESGVQLKESFLNNRYSKQKYMSELKLAQIETVCGKLITMPGVTKFAQSAALEILKIIQESQEREYVR